MLNDLLGVNPVPSGTVWTRHDNGLSEWWSYGAWNARKYGDVWVLMHGVKKIYEHEFLQESMKFAETPNRY